LEQVVCDNCGNEISHEDIYNVYSIKVDSQGYSVRISRGILQDALHYCCNACMFGRSKGAINPSMITRELFDK